MILEYQSHPPFLGGKLNVFSESNNVTLPATIRHLSGISIPVMHLSVILFLQPDGPNSANVSLAASKFAFR